ncbi:uncharacterized protein SAPINGB_P002882 [Magnusiomyces paraingens]|uniref:Uncharacterized protein n=1 Tax=Magnusiomyces paraingens TaxID=2606893 RepID=A0A5E8BGL8_9ASCO|nr:uncharacterized protein SAPINGB_P002882 [Saprochaete ingens]VVT50794.1 unnamed protein product [Saprochaete ingens]
MVETSKHIAIPLKTKVPVSQADLMKQIGKYSIVYQLIKPNPLNFFKNLYTDPVTFLSKPNRLFFNKHDDATPYLIMCFQEALFKSIGKLKKLEYLHYEGADFTFKPRMLGKSSLYSPLRQFTILSLQELVSSNNKSQNLKQVILKYSCSMEYFDRNDSFEQLAEESGVVSGTLKKKNELIMSDCYTIIPKPCKIYTYSSQEVENLSVLFDFEYFGSHVKNKDCILCTNAKESIQTVENEFFSPFLE